MLDTEVDAQEEHIQPSGDVASPSSVSLEHSLDPPAQRPASHCDKSSGYRRYYMEFESMRRAIAAQLSITAVILSTLIPFAALITWITRRQIDGSSFSTIFETFSGERIGGRLTQPQAKAIDVVTSAILAPLTVAAFNYVLFNSARVSIVSEKSRKPIPLRSLVAISSTSSGSYSLIRCGLTHLTRKPTNERQYVYPSPHYTALTAGAIILECY